MQFVGPGCLLLQMSPVTENMLSTGTEPADIPRNSEAS